MNWYASSLLGSSSPAREDSGLPDVRVDPARKECNILHCSDKMQNERSDRDVATAMLYGRVFEYMDISIDRGNPMLSYAGLKSPRTKRIYEARLCRALALKMTGEEPCVSAPNLSPAISSSHW